MGGVESAVGINIKGALEQKDGVCSFSSHLIRLRLFLRRRPSLICLGGLETERAVGSLE